MENINSNSDSLQFDDVNKSYLFQTAKWAKFLAVVGFVMIGILVIIGIFAGSVLGPVFRSQGHYSYNQGLITSGFISFIYIGISLIYFFPCLYLYRFSTKMILSFRTNEQEIFNQAFEQLKSCFKFVGIFTIVILSLYALIIVMVMMLGMSKMM